MANQNYVWRYEARCEAQEALSVWLVWVRQRALWVIPPGGVVFLWGVSRVASGSGRRVAKDHSGILRALSVRFMAYRQRFLGPVRGGRR